MVENEAEKLQQETAKAKARSRVFETSAIEGWDLKIEQYSTEALLIIGNSKYGGRTWDIDQSRHWEGIWEIPQSRQERDMVGMENEEIDRRVTARQADITSMICHLLKLQSTPDLNLDVFDENSLEYHNFMTLSHELVEKRIDNPKGRLTRLIRYTKGYHKDMIQHCLQ